MSASTSLSVYELFKDIVVLAAAVGGVLVAHGGLQTWKAQLRGTAEYDLTRRLLRATYRYRDGFSLVRHPVMFGSEYPPLPANFTGTREEERFHGVSGAYTKRWDSFIEARRELDAELLEAEVLWDKSIREPYQKLFGLQGELFTTLMTYLSAINPRNSEATRSANDQILRERRDSLYETNAEGDTFSKDLIGAIQDIEGRLKPHLRR